MPERSPAPAATLGWRLAMAGLAWPLGAALQLQQAHLDQPGFYALCAGIAGLCGLLAMRRWRLWWGGALALAVLAFAVTGLHASIRAADRLPAALEGPDLVVTGVIAELPQRTPNGLRFRFEVEQARRADDVIEVPSTVALGWYHGFDADAAPTADQQSLRAGQRWRFAVRLRRPHGLVNPQGFDQELRWFEEGVRATGTVRDAPPPQLLDRAAGHPIERLRQAVRDRIERTVPEPRSAGVLAALSIGDQSAIGREDWDLFRRTGIAHLVSISGLHVTLFAWIGGLAITGLWARSAQASLWVPAPTAGLVGGLALAAAYALLAGWEVPAQRTVWMLATVTVLRTAGLRWPSPLVLLAAASVVSAADPWALLQPGFWLSFAAVGLLMVSGPVQPAHAEQPSVTPGGSTAGSAAGPQPVPQPALRASITRWWDRLIALTAGAVRTQVIATLGLAPLTLVFFQQVSLIGFAANLVAIPFVTLLITPLALFGAVFPSFWLAGAWCVERLVEWLAWLASAPLVVWSVGVAPLWAQLAALLGALVLVMPLPWRLRLVALPLTLPLLMPPRDLPPSGHFELLAADVGQGTAVILRTRHHTLVYDAGPQYAIDSDAGQRVLVPLLRARGDERIDRLMLSHRDLDHVGGAPALLRALPVGALMSSLEDLHPVLLEARWREVPVQRCVSGQQWDWDGVRFEVLHPSEADYALPLRPNSMSCVLRVSGAGGSALVTGDIERDQEISLLRTQPDKLASDVLLVPHHGSRTSSSAAFLDAVRARTAVVQAGHLNRYGHPAGEVLERYRARSIHVVETPSCGAWTWRTATGAQGRVCARDAARRYWDWPGAAEH